MTRLRIAGLTALLADLAMTLAAWGRLPERAPVHWNLYGQADRMGPRIELALLGPILIAAIWGLFEVLRIVDPRLSAPKNPEATEQEKTGALQTVFALMLWLMFALHAVILMSGIGALGEPGRGVAIWMAAFLLLFGNFAGRLRPSWFVGIRTPWTLSSDAVWRRTHRLAARLMVAGGAVGLVCAVVLPAPAALAAAVALLLSSTLAPAVVSFFWWRAAR